MSAEYGQWTVAELRNELERRGMETGGRKAELVLRLEEAHHGQEELPHQPSSLITGEGEEEINQARNEIEEGRGVATPGTGIKIKPQRYDGKESWRVYHGLFERISRMNGWSAEQKLDYLWIHLAGEALNYVENLNSEYTVSYSALCQALDNRFGDNQSAELFKSLLRSRSRKPGESLQELAQDITQLVRRAYPEISRPGIEELAVERFREALPDHNQRMAVYHSKAKVLEQAVRAALDTESWQLSEKRRNPAARVRATQEEEDEEDLGSTTRAVKDLEQQERGKCTEEIKELLKNFLEQLPSSEHREKKNGLRCFHCNRLGDMKRDCKKKQAEDRRNQSGNDQQRR